MTAEWGTSLLGTPYTGTVHSFVSIVQVFPCMYQQLFREKTVLVNLLTKETNKLLGCVKPVDSDQLVVDADDQMLSAIIELNHIIAFTYRVFMYIVRNDQCPIRRAYNDTLKLTGNTKPLGIMLLTMVPSAASLKSRLDMKILQRLAGYLCTVSTRVYVDSRYDKDKQYGK